jgi:hypothetical protein
MPTPEAPRPPESGMARAIGKGSPGQQMGRMTGLSPIPRGQSRARRVAPAGEMGWVYGSFALRANLGLDFSSTVAPGAVEFSTPDSVGYSGTPADYLNESDWTIAREGLYLWAASVSLTGPAGSVVGLGNPEGSPSEWLVLPDTSGSDLEVNLTATWPFVVGDFLVGPSVHNRSGATVTIAEMALSLYPIILP